MPSCFIIMPISTPDHLVAQYKNDKEHFIHVLDCLFVPAIEKAGLKPIKPIMKGSEIIQAEIIELLNDSELVLCDMSILNPNVFFELGIRTALNKPVAMVKDHKLDKIPFDNSPINCHPYKGELNPWEMEHEIDELSKHIKACMEKGTSENALWRYFGIKNSGELSSGSGDFKEYFNILDDKMNDIMSSLKLYSRQEKQSPISHKDIIEQIDLLNIDSIANYSINENYNEVQFVIKKGKYLDEKIVSLMNYIKKTFGYTSSFDRQK